MLKLQTHASISEIGREQWHSLLGEGHEPHLSWEFLDVLERTGCVSPEVGWVPSHLALYRDEQLVAAAPAYIKTNSEGEFVFDHTWAEFAYRRLGVDYFPKLLLAVPFTPATGRRLLTLPGEDRRTLCTLLLQGALQVCEQLQLSGAHVLFPAQPDPDPYALTSFHWRKGIQYQWHNPGYTCFDDFLSRFSSKRRNQIRRERREVCERGLNVIAVEGADVTPPLVDRVFDFYRATVDRHVWGRQYLNRAFFEELCTRMPRGILLLLAQRRGAAVPVGGTFNLIGGGTLYGRYWGASEEQAFLHFEVCYYRGIEEAIARGCQRFEPGAGGEHKLSRGFEPTVTHSFHHLVDPRLASVVQAFLQRERGAVEEYQQAEAGALKPWGARK